VAIDKGGVGKSFFCIQMIGWLRSQKIAYSAYDPDHANSSLSRFIPEAIFINARHSENLDAMADRLQETPFVLLDGMVGRQGLIFDWMEETNLCSVSREIEAVKKVVNGFVARHFCGDQGASEEPIPSAVWAERVTPSTAKMAATQRAGTDWAVWRRWSLSYSPQRGCAFATALPYRPIRSRAPIQYFFHSLLCLAAAPQTIIYLCPIQF
jgi:hypothetical protein